MHARGNAAVVAAGKRGRPAKWIVAGTFWAGTADLAFAVGFWAIRADVPPVRILQSIASGVLGKASYAGGAASATLGAVLHYAIMAGMMAAYFLVARRIPRLTSRWRSMGALYGLWLYVAMTRIVVPLSAAGPGSTNPTWVSASIAMHVAIGVACAWFARRALRG